MDEITLLKIAITWILRKYDSHIPYQPAPTRVVDLQPTTPNRKIIIRNGYHSRATQRSAESAKNSRSGSSSLPTQTTAADSFLQVLKLEQLLQLNKELKNSE